MRVEAAVRPEPQRRAVTHVDDTGERTITLLSHKLVSRKDDPLPWAELAEYDAVYFTGGDAAALRAARVARSLVATARELPTLVEAEVQLDALVRSGRDPGETYEEGWLDPPPRIAVATEGPRAGSSPRVEKCAATRPPSYRGPYPTCTAPAIPSPQG